MEFSFKHECVKQVLGSYIVPERLPVTSKQQLTGMVSGSIEAFRMGNPAGDHLFAANWKARHMQFPLLFVRKTKRFCAEARV